MALKTKYLNLDDTAIKGWMALHNLLWRFGITAPYYETSNALKMLIRLQNRKDSAN